MWCNVGFAEIKHSVNYYTKLNYKIIKYVSDGNVQFITLEKRGHVIICSVRFTNQRLNQGTRCFEP